MYSFITVQLSGVFIECLLNNNFYVKYEVKNNARKNLEEPKIYYMIKYLMS